MMLCMLLQGTGMYLTRGVGHEVLARQRAAPKRWCRIGGCGVKRCASTALVERVAEAAHKWNGGCAGCHRKRAVDSRTTGYNKAYFPPGVFSQRLLTPRISHLKETIV